jgi:methylamine utilization protein MauE
VSDFVGIVQVAATLTLSIVFGAAGISKLTDPASFAQALGGYGIRDELWRRTLGLAVPATEMFVAVLWVSPSDRLFVAAVTLALLAIFTAAVVMLPKSATPCGCGGLFADGPAGWNVIARNIVLSALVCATLLNASASESTLSGGELVAGGALACAGLLVALVGLDALLVAELRLREARRSPTQ